MENIWNESVWDDDVEEITPEEVIIEDNSIEEDDTDSEWFADLMADDLDEEEETIREFKADPYLNSFIPSAPVKTSNITDNAKAAYTYLNSKGLPSHVSAGIVGNLMRESGVNPNTRDGDNRGGIGGIAQWDPQRSQALRNYTKTPQDLYSQLDFLVDEAQQRGDLQATLNAKTPEEAAVIFGRKYERPNEKLAHWDERQAYAKQIHSKQYGGVNNIPEEVLPDLTGVSDQVINDYLIDEVSPEQYMPSAQFQQPENNTVQKIVNGVQTGVTAFKNITNKINNMGVGAANTVSEAIDFQNEMAGIQRNAVSLRKFNGGKNVKKFSANRTQLNQPLIYT